MFGVMEHWSFAFLSVFIFLEAGTIVDGLGSKPRITQDPEDAVVLRNEPVTLNCKAEGDPMPKVTWYKDGAPLELVPRRVQLKGGLFFLRVMQTRKESDAGVYFCQATNAFGVAKSKEANLSVAYLRDDFRATPVDSRFAVGTTARLRCSPPRGVPFPKVRWLKDGRPVTYGERLQAEGDGDLVFKNIQKQDEGAYVCSAKNEAGEKQTDPAILMVLVKPFFIERPPPSVTLIQGSNATLLCRFGGDPLPKVSWVRKGGQLPFKRSHVIRDLGLQLTEVTVRDEGTYICRGENDVGALDATTKISVQVPPSLPMRPSDQEVTPGSSTSLECMATGKPTPLVLWMKADDQNARLPSTAFTSSLSLMNVTATDAGIYSCLALNPVGSSIAYARLVMIQPEDQPPPVIDFPPANQTLPLGSLGEITCDVSGAESIDWLKDDRPMVLRGDRITYDTKAGLLRIKDLERGDSGMYTCIGRSASGYTMASAFLEVRSPTNPNVAFQKNPSRSVLPGPPLKPKVVEAKEGRIQLEWRVNPRPGASPVIDYLVDFWSRDRGSGWVRAAENLSTSSLTLEHLKAGTYIFYVRARNSHGLSMSSPLSEPITLTDNGVSVQERITISLEDTAVKLDRPVVLGARAVRLNWQVVNESFIIEGFQIRFRAVAPTFQQHTMEDPSEGVLRDESPATASEFDFVTLMVRERSSSYDLKGLKPHTPYEVFLLPFAQGILGRPSNLQFALTDADAPVGGPAEIVVHAINETEAFVKWEPLAPHHWNGPGTYYQIYLSSVNSTTEFKTNQTSLHLSSLIPEASYRLAISACNRAACSPPGVPFPFTIDPNASDTPRVVPNPEYPWTTEVWFIAVLVSIILIIIFVFVFLFTLRRKGMKLSNLASQVVGSSMQGKGSELYYHSNGNGGPESGKPIVKDPNGAITSDPENSLWTDSKWRFSDYCNDDASDALVPPNAVGVMTKTTDLGGGRKGMYVALPGGRNNSNPSPAPYASTSLIQSYLQENQGSSRTFLNGSMKDFAALGPENSFYSEAISGNGRPAAFDWNVIFPPPPPPLEEAYGSGNEGKREREYEELLFRDPQPGSRSQEQGSTGFMNRFHSFDGWDSAGSDSHGNNNNTNMSASMASGPGGPGGGRHKKKRRRRSPSGAEGGRFRTATGGGEKPHSRVPMGDHSSLQDFPAGAGPAHPLGVQDGEGSDGCPVQYPKWRLGGELGGIYAGIRRSPRRFRYCAPKHGGPRILTQDPRGMAADGTSSVGSSTQSLDQVAMPMLIGEDDPRISNSGCDALDLECFQSGERLPRDVSTDISSVCACHSSSESESGSEGRRSSRSGGGRNKISSLERMNISALGGGPSEKHPLLQPSDPPAPPSFTQHRNHLSSAPPPPAPTSAGGRSALSSSSMVTMGSSLSQAN